MYAFELSVEVKVFHATETYSSLDLTKVKYNIERSSVDKKEKVTAQIRLNIFKACENI
jgi:hypothetical protein